MKRIIALIAIVVSAQAVLLGQQQVPVGLSPLVYDSLKSAGALNTGVYYIDASGQPESNPVIQQPPVTPQAPANCECIIPLDATFQVVPFPFGTPPLYRNDDGSSAVINLPFNFCFYGQNFNQVYINNNGNISFNNPYGAFSSASFPSANYTMIAPFWADVDTRGLASGVVHYKVTPTAMIVRWNIVGYFSQHTDKLNDFQLIITDGTDPLLPPGSNAAFCYGDMQWTTGDASGGVNGFGGTAATVGANLGDGINYIQIGRFDAPGTNYNGPFGPASQVSWLDNKQFFLDICTAGGGGNLPPIMNANQVCDTFDLCVGDTFIITAQFLSPENNQLTSATATTTGTGLTIVPSAPANPVNLNAFFVGLPSNIGINTITISGTDNGTPAQTTSGLVVINVVPGPTAAFTATSACPNEQIDFSSATTVTINGPIVDYHWDFGVNLLTNDTSNIADPSYTYPLSGSYTVVLEVTDSLGCSDTAQRTITVYELPVAAFSGDPLTGCSPLCVDFTDLTTVTNSSAAQWLWEYSDGGSDTVQNPNHCFVNQGQYDVTLYVTSAEGCKDTLTIAQMVDVIPGPVAEFTLSPQPATLNNSTIYFTDQSTNGPVEWQWFFDENGATSNVQNPYYTYQDTGVFSVMLVVSAAGGACPDTMIHELLISPELLIWIPNAFTPNADGNNDLFMPVFSSLSYVREYEMLVFDRWGNLIFKTIDPLKGWDGSFNSKQVQIDTYVYKITMKDLDGKSTRYIGGVNLIR
jgi:gliding motility-associated-like protein